jgi:hypothetical protein
VRDCVGFLCVKVLDGGQEKYRYGGTAFFVSVPSAVEGRSYHYIVTAKHCVIKAQSTGGLHLRVNLKAGGSVLVPMSDSWAYDAGGPDVAVQPCALSPDLFQFRTVPLSIFAVPSVIADKDIGPGDELFLTGLFTMHGGLSRNSPVVRSGVLAAMPTDPITDETGLVAPAYIAEVRSIGGLSGSPVFVELGPTRPRAGAITFQREYFLLGLVRGHWDQQRQGPAVAFTDDEARAINMGMAIITPADDLRALLMRGDQVAERKRADEELAQKDVSAN